MKFEWSFTFQVIPQDHLKSKSGKNIQNLLLLLLFFLLVWPSAFLERHTTDAHTRAYMNIHTLYGNSHPTTQFSL